MVLRQSLGALSKRPNSGGPYLAFLECTHASTYGFSMSKPLKPFLLTGLRPSIVAIIPEAAITYGAFDILKKGYRKLAKVEEVPVPAALFCGVSSALMGQIVAFPLELVSRRLQVRTAFRVPHLASVSDPSFLRPVGQGATVLRLRRRVTVDNAPAEVVADGTLWQSARSLSVSGPGCGGRGAPAVVNTHFKVVALAKGSGLQSSSTPLTALVKREYRCVLTGRRAESLHDARSFSARSK